jgi:hypothetical protein
MKERRKGRWQNEGKKGKKKVTEGRKAEKEESST